MKLNLSSTQIKIVDHTEGALLVKAGPGSGKTRVLIERIKRLLLTKRRCKVLALTFSNLAAEEMKSRLQEDATVEEHMGNVTVGTIHSFCLDLVQNRGNLIGLESDLVLFEDATDKQRILRDIFSRSKELNSMLKEKAKPDVFLKQCLDMISDEKKKFIAPQMSKRDDTFRQIYAEYNEYLLEQNAIDFDDILFYAYRILSENPSVVKMYTTLYRYICVDEAQDLNFAQYEVLKALCGNEFKNVMLVGDENQSIYGFNGSDSRLMVHHFVEDFSPVVYILNENFRSARAIVAYANQLEGADSVCNYYYEGELKSYSLENEEEEARYILNCIEYLMQNGNKDVEGPLKYDDFAIIARNRYGLAKVEHILKKNEIPYYFKKTVSGIDSESDYIKIFELSMRLLINPKDVIHLRELLSYIGLNEKVVENTNTGIDLLSNILVEEYYVPILNAMMILKGERFEFGKALRLIKEEISKLDAISEEEKYLIYSDLELWKRHWNKYIGQVQSEARSMVSFRNYISLGKTQDISGDNGIALLTAHMSKGLQYEVVFVVGLTEGTFPDYRAAKTGGKAMEQEKNNMFVAVTRAKRLCYLTYPRYKQMPWGDVKWQQKSRFLNILPVHEV